MVFTDDETLFPAVDTEFEGIPGKAYMPCVYAKNAHNVRIEGAGVLDGSGARWWQKLRQGTLAIPGRIWFAFRTARTYPWTA